MMSNKIWKRMNHAWVWMKRIRHRCGYGVHSPFAFDFITNVIYERTPYYAYEDLEKELDGMAKLRGKEWKEDVPRKVRRLLFKMVNRMQPHCLLYVGPDSPAIPFLKAPRQALVLKRVDWDAQEPAAEREKWDFVVLDALRLKEGVPDWWKRWKGSLHTGSVLVIRGVGTSKENRAVWAWLKEQPETGISFDLYEVGIVFMDLSRVKQHYVVNF